MQNHKIKNNLVIATIILKETINSFIKNNNFEMSAALATYGFFSLIPLLFFIAYLFGNYAIFSQRIFTGVENMIGHLFPNLGQFITEGFFFLTNYRITWGVVTLLVVFVSIMSLTDSLRTAFIKIFNIDRNEPFIKTQFLNAYAAFVTLFLFCILIIAEMLYAMFLDTLPKGNPMLQWLVYIAVSLVVGTFCMSVFYTTFLPVKLGINHLLTASFVSAILIISMREAFSSMLVFKPDYGLTFGSLKNIFIIIIWVYYCFLVLLFGAELIVNFIKRDALLLKGLFLEGIVTDKSSKHLAKKFLKHYKEGDVIVKEGDEGNSMFYIISGSVNILKKDQIIRVMKKGEYFGEMSMLLDTPRTATIIAAQDDTQLISISQDNFELILRENPKIVMSILKEMTMRLKITGENI